MQHTLLIYQPGHFHAALLLKTPTDRIAQDIHLYASKGPECDAFVALIDAFNARDEDPTHWVLHIHNADTPADALQRLIDERRGEAVVLAGQNDNKLNVIAQLHDNKFWVIADKPWVTTPQALIDLQHSCHGSPLAMDIMPDRHELLARLRKRIVSSHELFGEFKSDDAQGPAIEISSVHHLYKIVNGEPLRRPAWYYDTNIQGDGIVDVQSHITDQSLWLVGEKHIYDYDADIQLDSARRWPTPVSKQLFKDSTGMDEWPAALVPAVQDDVLQCQCNGEINFRLRGVSVRQTAIWGQVEPEGGGDLHGAVVRGTRAVLRVEHGEHTDFIPQVQLFAREGIDLQASLQTALRDWQDEFPGLDIKNIDGGWQFIAPNSLHSSHESHFAKEMGGFLDCMDSGAWPNDLQARIYTRHRLLIEALRITK